MYVLKTGIDKNKNLRRVSVYSGECACQDANDGKAQCLSYCLFISDSVTADHASVRKPKDEPPAIESAVRSKILTWQIFKQYIM